jgi:hypothetical protein
MGVLLHGAPFAIPRSRQQVLIAFSVNVKGHP